MDALSLALGLIAGALIGGFAASWFGRSAGEARAAAEARLDETASRLEALQTALKRAEGERESARLEAAAAHQNAASMRERIADWEATKAELLRSTRAGVIETAQQLSSKLIEDHRRETAEARAQAARETEAVTATLQAEVKALTDGVAQMKGQLSEKAEVLDTVWRALTSPGGAGHFAEIGLANTLTSFGLLLDRDFVLQPGLTDAEGQRKRPDALVFLPGNGVLVVDAKASKHLVDLALAVSEEGEAAAYRSLARTMNQHLKDLADRDYQNAVAVSYRQSGRSTTIQRQLTVMYLPSETALEKIGRADPEFHVKAAQKQIVLAGPAGLASVIGFASVEISLMRQAENEREIVAATEKLLESLSVALGHAGGVGRGLRAAADSFAKLSSSFNARVLPRARELIRHGLKPPKQLPGNLPGFQVLELDIDTVDGEATDVPQMIQNQTKF
jgi:DNA recombination protein RmuC